MRTQCCRVVFCALVGASLLMTGCPNNSEPEEGPVTQSDILDTDSSADIIVPPARACESNTDCQGLQGETACTTAVCDRLVSQCRLFDIPGCCLVDTECDDNDPQTTDTCNQELNICQSAHNEIACQADLDCDTGESCIYFGCDLVCIYYQKPECCLEDADCDDGDSCTTDTCTGFTCSNTPSESPVCCGEVLFSETFSDGFSPLSSVESNGGDVLWQTSAARWRTPPMAAWFGNKATGTYENPLLGDGSQLASVGTFLSQPIQIPESGGTLRFSVWVDVESVLEWDLFEARIAPVSGQEVVLWSKSLLNPEGGYRTWIDVDVDVSSFAGVDARFSFSVDTIDATVNTGEGIYIDDIVLVTACDAPPKSCTSDAECDDGDICTVNACGGDGFCAEQVLDGCCATAADCEGTVAICSQAQCVDNTCSYVPIDGCCQSNADCPAVDCQTVTCELNTSACVYVDIPGCCTPESAETACNDDNPCTADSCVSSVCTNTNIEGCEPCGEDSECNDSNACTADACLGGACVYTEISGCVVCQSESDCTVSNPICELPTCIDGACGIEVALGCAPCSADTECNDGEPCTNDVCSNGYCDVIAVPNCTLECETGLNCDDDNACTIDACNNGLCINGPIPDCCTDDSQCSTSDPCLIAQCTNNKCVTSPNGSCGGCQTNLDCNDSNGCTADTCNNGTCLNEQITDCCTDDSQCVTSDPCLTAQCVDNECVTSSNGSCGGCQTNLDCDDSNECTADICTNGVCLNEPIADCCTDDSQCVTSDPCLDALCVDNACVTSSNGTCDGCQTNSDCADGNECTIDFCVPSTGDCLYPPNPIPGCPTDCISAADCDGTDVCTTYVCVGGLCQGSLIPGCCTSEIGCDDANVCTDEICDLETNTCQITPIPDCEACDGDFDCDDNNACTAETCQGGICESVQLPGCCLDSNECDDGEPCTADACVNNGCVYTPVANCCTANDDCVAEQPCQEGVCLDEQCSFTQNPDCCVTNADCDDGIGCTTDTCDTASGQCSYQKSLGCCATDADCFSSNPCLASTCGANNQCTSSLIPGCCIANVECEDGDECTYNQCIDNQCVAPVDIPGCCFGVVLGAETFDSGSVSDWDFELIGAANWQIASGQALSPPNSLWFGNPLTGDFSEPSDGTPSGSVTTSPYVIPADKYAKATFSIWADVELPLAYDQIELRVLDEADDAVVVWDKSALLEQQSWQTFQVNLSAFAGKTIRLQWWFDGVDPVSNDGQGVFIDDLAVQTFCDPVDTCVFNTECDDGDSCTDDICVSGVCVSNSVPNCCTADTECDDNYECTTDSCIAGTCTYDPLPGCCQFNIECDDGNDCTTDVCIANQCAYQPEAGAAGCCVVVADCDDGDECTQEKCVDSTCQYVASSDPSCCTAGPLLAADFDDATTEGFAFLDGGTSASWSVQAKRFSSPPFSLYFGIPGQWTYATDPASNGAAISPEFAVPITADTVTLTFATWVDIASLGFVSDIFDVRVLIGSTLQTVWTFSDAPISAQWTTVKVDLSEYKGQTIRLYWNFQSQEIVSASLGEGIYVDDILVASGCGP